MSESVSAKAAQQQPLTKRRRKQWCYECQTYTLVHRYRTDLLEEQIDLCDSCASADYSSTGEADG